GPVLSRHAATLADRAPSRRPAGAGGDARAPALLRVLPAQDGGAGGPALGLRAPLGAVAAAVRVRDLRRGRQHPGAHPRHRVAHPARDDPHAGRAPHLRGRLARRGGPGGAGLLGRRRAAHRRAAGRPAAGRGALRAASRGLCLRGRPGGGPAPHRALRDQRRRLPGGAPDRPFGRPRHRQLEAEDRRGRHPRHHAVLLRHRCVPALPGSLRGGGHHRADRPGHLPGEQHRPGEEVQRHVRRQRPWLDGPPVRRAG
ncbi:MAG: 5,10-methylenetetrahydrofolate reductase, partial [uncultured Acetobacteraceae bacterium]